MSESKLSSVLLVGLFVFSLLAVGGAGTAAAGNSIDTSANAPLEDGGIYWHGQVLYNDTVANAGERLQLHNGSSDAVVRDVSAGNSGLFTVDTGDLRGKYYLQNESDQTVAQFQVVEQEIDFRYQNYYRVDNGTATHVLHLEINSNRGGGYALALESPTLNLTKRIDSAQVVNGTTYVSSADLPAEVNVSDLEDGTHRIDANVSDTPVQANKTVRPSNYTRVEFVRHPPTEELVSGNDYWQGHTLAYDHEPTDETLNVYTEEGAYANQVASNETGWYVFDSGDLEGGYYLENDTHQLATFLVRNHWVNTSFADATVTEGTGETNLSVTSNRTGYDLLLWAENLSRETLHEAVPSSTVTNEGDLVVQNLSDDTSLSVNYSAVPAGNYTLYLAGNDTAAKSTATLTVTADSSGGDDGNDDGGDDGGNGGSGSSGGGGGAGGAPPPAVQVEDVASGDDYRRAKVANARADNPASVSLSGLGTDRASFDRLRITPESEEAEPRFFVNASTLDDPGVAGPTEGETLAYLSVETTYIESSALASVRITFRVPAAGTDPEGVTLYHRANGTWEPLSTSLVDERGGDYVFRAEATGFSLFAVGETDVASIGSETETATKTPTSGPAELTATTTEESGNATTAATEETTQSSGPVGHDAASVLVPLVALFVALGHRTRN
ncbi:PGF-pre-PGF domain-containing protein [Halorussus lipolyticus]|uniref:PGF-pre-PGF domain-containing protein n=1 Tax=Halorussus lipolyticus TaxID=3034024 RepID=UPI0023E7E9EB|nr:PGF-pre-PGF domain-containing protein [Halorussus sp. DT80]